MSSPPARSARQPRYAWLRECLLNDIRSGKYRVGTLLPTENELSRLYKVSRHTVREASRKLADDGIISRRAGLGTLVCAPREKVPHVAALGSLQELLDHTSVTRLEVLADAAVTADEALAAALECAPGTQWVELRALRHAMEQAMPIAFATIYLRPEFGSIRSHLHGRHRSIYDMLERHHGQVIHVVRQEIAATLMPPDAARVLDVRHRSPALHLQRMYLDASGRVLAVSSNLYPAERFRLRTSWTKESGHPNKPPGEPEEAASG